MHRLRLAIYLDDGLTCGGTENVVSRLIHHWAKQGHEIALIARDVPDKGFFPLPSGIACLALRSSGAPPSGETRMLSGWLAAAKRLVRRHAPARSLLRLLREALLLRSVVRQWRAQIVIGFLTPGNVKVLLATCGLSCRTIVCERSDTRNFSYPGLWTWLRTRLYRHADLVTANLPESVADLSRYVPASRLLYLPNPIALPPPAQQARPDLSQRILAVGRLVPYKRHMLLIEAFARLDERFRDWQLDIVGDGPMLEELQQAVHRAGLAGRVHLHGLQREVADFYRQAAIFVLPSSVEGTPNAWLEAMGHAVPGIISDAVPAAGALAADSSLLFRSGDAADLAAQITYLAGQAERRREMGRRVRQWLEISPSVSAYPAWDAALAHVGGMSRPDSAEAP